MNESIANELLPVRVKAVAIPSATDLQRIRTTYYILANNGDIISNALRRDWAEHIAEALNEPEMPIPKKRSRMPLLAVVIMDYAPPDHKDGKAVTVHPDGKITIDDNQDYQRALACARKSIRRGITKGRFPVTTPCQIQAEFTVPSMLKHQLGDLCGTLIDILFDAEILPLSRYNIVKSLDGSCIKYSDDPLAWGTRAYIREYDNA
jgi:hypothetical protein